MANLKERGFSEICFRMNIQPILDTGVKVFIGCVPYDMNELMTKPFGGSRFFAMIKVMEVRGKFYPMEKPHHKFGTAIQPLLLLEDSSLNDQGDLIIDEIVWPDSQKVKDTQATLLQSATMPNYHLAFDKWVDSVTKGITEKRPSPLKWPTPRREDEDTEMSGLEDTDDGE